MAWIDIDDLIKKYGEDTVDMLAADAHQHTAGGADSDAVDDAIEEAEQVIRDELVGLYEGQFTEWDTNCPVAIKRKAIPLAAIFLKDRGSGRSENDDRVYDRILEVLQRWGKGTLKVEGVAKPSWRRAKSSVNDGRVPETKRSHYDNDGERIEGDAERTPYDVR